MNNVFLAFALTLIAGLSTGIGSCIAFFAKHTNRKFLSISLGFSAGVMIYVSMIEIFVKAQDSLVSELGKIAGNWVTVGSFFGGMLVIAGLVQFVEMFLKKNIPTLYTALGVYLPLITTNCAVLGVALLNTQNDYNFIESVVYGITGGLGFLLAIFLFAAVREQLEVSGDNPKAFDGFPIALVTAGLMALAFMGFSGLKVW